MTVPSDKAVQHFRDGCNCSQAVLAALSQAEGLGEEDAMRLGAAFGGGMRRGEVCGAVTGALMALGLRHGSRQAAQLESKTVANEKTTQYMNAFKDRYGSYTCRELIQSSGKKVCEQLVAGAVALLDELDDRDASSEPGSDLLSG